MPRQIGTEGMGKDIQSAGLGIFNPLSLSLYVIMGNVRNATGVVVREIMMRCIHNESGPLGRVNVGNVICHIRSS